MEVKSDLDASMESSSTALEVMDELEVECIEAIELMCLVPKNSGRARSDYYDTDPDYSYDQINDLKRKSRSYETESFIQKKSRTDYLPEVKTVRQVKQEPNGKAKPKSKQKLPDEPIKCQYCDYSTRRKNHLIVHERAHTNDKPYACQYCDYTTIQQSTLTRHERTHTNEKRYFCQYCDYKAARKDHLVVHERTHTHEKPYACSYCAYRAATKSDLTVHERTHTHEKPYACSSCPYTTTQQSTLTVHERIHTNEKPYLCKLCPYRAAQLSSLNNHLRTHH